MTLSMVEKAMTMKIKPSDIKYLVAEMAKRHEAGQQQLGFEAQVFILLARHGKKKTDKIFAIVERMRCLLKLMDDERMRGWTMESVEPGCTLTHEAVFDATATCRLLDKNGHFAFDADEFFQVALTHMPAAAKA